MSKPCCDRFQQKWKSHPQYLGQLLELTNTYEFHPRVVHCKYIPRRKPCHRASKPCCSSVQQKWRSHSQDLGQLLELTDAHEFHLRVVHICSIPRRKPCHRS